MSLRSNQEFDLHECHEPRDEAVASPAEDPEKAGQEGRADDKTNEPALDKVCYEEHGCGLIETMFLFEKKGLIDLERKGRKT